MRLHLIITLVSFWFCGCRTTQPAPPQISEPTPEPPVVETVRQTLELPEQLTDGVVLQRNQPIAISGWDAPGQLVLGQFAGQTKDVIAGEDGTFQFQFSPLEAGGPYSLQLTGSRPLMVRDILVGDVWFCVGQSNMEWPLAETVEGGRALAEPDDLNLRIFNVEPRGSWTQEKSVRGFWQPSIQQERVNFSAVAYHFGKTLRAKQPGVPIGIYEASLSGSAIEPWMPKAAFETDLRLQLITKQAQKLGPDPLERDEEKRLALLTWLNASLVPLTERTPEELPWHSAPLSDEWRPVTVPGRWEKTLQVNFDGVVWFRRTVEVPESWAGQPLQLTLGQIDDFDQAFFNGVSVGRTLVETPASFAKVRRYVVPAEVVKAGRNELVVCVTDYFSGGGMSGPASQLSLAPATLPEAEPISLAGDWLYRVESIVPTKTPPAPPLPGFNGNPADSPSALFNGMISPLNKMRTAGVVWYQGESNAFYANLYGEKWSALQRTWREEFTAPDWPFVMVELPGFGESLNPTTIPWAEFREVQQHLAQEDRMTALISVLDLGNCKDVHPRRKEAIGSRLAHAALNLQRNGTTLHGPHYKSCKQNDDGSILIETEGVVGKLKHSENQSHKQTPTSFWASSGNGIFTPAEAKLIGNKILVSSPTLDHIEHVRYAWANCPTAIVVDEAGLPLFPFRTDSYKESVMVFEEAEQE